MIIRFSRASYIKYKSVSSRFVSSLQPQQNLSPIPQKINLQPQQSLSPIQQKINVPIAYTETTPHPILSMKDIAKCILRNYNDSETNDIVFSTFL